MKQNVPIKIATGEKFFYNSRIARPSCGNVSFVQKSKTSKITVEMKKENARDEWQDPIEKIMAEKLRRDWISFHNGAEKRKQRRSAARGRIIY